LIELTLLLVSILSGLTIGVLISRRRQTNAKGEPRVEKAHFEKYSPIDPVPDFIGSSFSVLLNDGENRPNHREIRSLSIRGSSHYEDGTPRQDSHTILRRNGQIIVAVSDGVSEASQAHFGSELAIKRLPSSINSVFSGQVNTDISLWNEVNRKLSASLVKASIDKGETTLDSNQLRMKAAELFATTMELLVIDETVNQRGNYGYFYVRLAGDGGLLKISNNAITNALDGSSVLLAKDSNLVSALPVNDGAPIIVEGELKVGESLLQTTDGFSEALSISNELEHLLTQHNLRNIEHVDVVKVYTIAQNYSADDLTFISISIS